MKKFNCKWSWAKLRCVRPPPPPPVVPASVLPIDLVTLGLLLLGVVAVLVLLTLLLRRPPGLVRTGLRLVFFRGRRFAGRLTGLVFPIHAGDLTPELLTSMLRHGGHLDESMSVATVSDRLAQIRDGVKGDKAIIDVTYTGSGPPTALPRTFFVKFGIGKLSAMRLLCAASEVHECEALFYHQLASLAAEAGVRTPSCYFVDYHEVSGEMCLVTELLPFGSSDVPPLKHRVRDAPLLEEQKLLVRAGAQLHVRLWGHAALRMGLRRYDATHRRAWPLMQLIGLTGLRKTATHQLGSQPLSSPFATWAAPAELIGHELALARDMPAILTSLCEEAGMCAFGHNDIVTDNIWFGPRHRHRGGDHRVVGLFDWQQSCVNSLGQEWAWNWHFLPPDFLTAHEDELLDTALAVYRAAGKPISRTALVRHYVLGVAQMYVFSGGGLQALLKRLHKRGLLSSLVPDDERTRDGSLNHDAPLLEMLVGAEMSRRAFTNACNIMRRHGFVDEWRAWRRTRGLPPVI